MAGRIIVKGRAGRFCIGDDNMANKKYRFLSVPVLIGIIMLLVLGAKPALTALGKHELYRFAVEKNYCRSESCEDGIAYVTALLQKEYRIPADIVPWCMAANRVYFTDLSFANAIKVKFAEWMYQSCENDNLSLEDANITIGEPHGH